MTAIRSSSYRSFKELSVQARTLLFIYASAASARYRADIPNLTMLLIQLETFWGAHQLDVEALSDPDRMTRLLEKHFKSLSSEALPRAGAKSKMYRSGV